MIKSTRSKRRKIKNELDILQEISVCSTLNEEDTYVLEQQEIETTVLNSSFSSIDSSQNSLNQIPQNMPINSNMVEILPSCISNNTFSTPLSDNFSIKDFLKHWAIQFNIKQNAFDGLLKGLKTHECFKNLPNSSRTILETPTNSSNLIRNVKPGIYYHFGLAKGIQMYAPNNLSTIKIAIGIDGLPLSKSSSSQFWPILAYIANHPSYKTVFPIGIYHGNKKPSDSNDFLLDLVEEVKRLTLNGIILNDTKVNVVIHLICCDAPAKSFILKVKGHTGFFSCTRCSIEGEYVNRRICFPYTQSKSVERTHIGYVNALDEDYHSIPNVISNISELNNIDLVKLFPVDYMHLVCLGVMKKLLFLWVQKGPLNVRLRSTKINELSSLLLSLNSCTTSDFVRKNRSIQDLCRWKATEFRLFLLYSGQVVLKNIISKECYNNFMSLNIAMMILLSPDFEFLLDYAGQLLDFFVQSFQNIYGVQYVSHNIHGLLHLCDDYIEYGPLDNCSAFKFENHMKQLKSYLRKHEKPLQQVINRYHERYADQLTPNQQLSTVLPIFKNMHNNGPLLNNITGTQYHTIIFNKMKINIKNDKDSFIITKQKQIVKCLNFIQNDNEAIIFIGKKYKMVTPYFVEPIDSTLLEVFEVQNLSDRLYSWKVSDIKKKMMILKVDGKNIAMAIIHTEI